MKKRAFTLAEALIALGIVGVVAALMLPMANKARPDEMKISYLKTYDSLSMAVNSLTNASKLYNPVLYSNELSKTYNIQEYPLLDTYTEKNLNGTNCGNGTEAFGKLLKVVFNGKDADDGWFVTKDNKAFLVESNVGGHVLTNASSDKVKLYYTITVDLNGTNKGVNALYSEDNTKPDRFKFFVLPNGAVVAADVYGKMYIDTRNNHKKLSDDVIAAKLESLVETTETEIETADNGIIQSEIVIAELDPTDNTIIADGGSNVDGEDNNNDNDTGSDDGNGTGSNDENDGNGGAGNNDSDDGAGSGDSGSVAGAWPWTPGTGVGTIGGTPTVGIGDGFIGGTPVVGIGNGTSPIGGGGGSAGGDGVLVTDPHYDNNGNGTPDIWDCDPSVNLNMSMSEIMACQQQNSNTQFIQSTGGNWGGVVFRP